MKMILLRYVLMVDAAVLFLLGGLMILFPRAVETAFQFRDLPIGVSYMIAMWGCVFGTLGIGYVVAATNPLRHVAWVQVGIARGALECVVGIVFLARGIVSFQQAGFGVIVAAAMAMAYLALYPRAATANPK
jgi:hypothetical protein